MNAVPYLLPQKSFKNALNWVRDSVCFSYTLRKAIPENSATVAKTITKIIRAWH